MKDSEFLSWIWGRMVNVHGEKSNVDYMLRLNGIILAMKDNDAETAISFKQPKPRTKTKYELLCNSNFNVWGLKDLLESGSLFYFINDEYSPVSVGSDIFAIEHFLSGHIYRKVEIEIDERQEFIYTAVELLNQNSHDNEANHYKEWFGAMFDSGKFKLVECK